MLLNTSSGVAANIAVQTHGPVEVDAVHAAGRPNIVLIVVDDIGYSDFGAFGGEIDTPNIDGLARQGTRFANFHTASSCAPTRAMLMTGLDNHLAGIGSMRELMPLSHRGKPGYGGVLDKNVKTVATRLQQAGYRTAVSGKWHLGVQQHNLPPARGFDYSFIQADSGADNFEMRPYLPMTPEARWYENGRRLASLPDNFYSSTYLVDRALDFLGREDAGSSPFFLYLAFQANHTPLQAPTQVLDRYRGQYLEGWAEIWRQREAKVRREGLVAPGASLASGPAQSAWDALPDEQRYFEARRMQAYAAMATAMDAELGRLLTFLREVGEYERTVFVLLSDNGATVSEPYANDYGRRWLEQRYHRDVETLGQRGSWVAAGQHWGRVSNAPFAGSKFSAGEGGLRVPLIVSGLTGITPGSVQRAFVHVTDIAPTLLSIAGAFTEQDVAQRSMSGHSLLPLLTEGAMRLRDPDDVVGYEFSGNAALYRDRYKLTRNLPPAGDRRWRLYDLEADPGENHDLSQQMPERFGQMQQDYAHYARTTGVLPMPESYSLVSQVMINAALFFYLPRYLPLIFGAFTLIALILFYRRGSRAV